MPVPRTKREKALYWAGYDTGKADFFKKWEQEKAEKENLRQKLNAQLNTQTNTRVEAFTKLINAAGQSMAAIANTLDIAVTKL